MSAAPDMLEHALGYLKHRRPVFAVCSPLFGAHTHPKRINDRWREEPCPKDDWGKIPLVSWGRYQQALPTGEQYAAATVSEKSVGESVEREGQEPSKNPHRVCGDLSDTVSPVGASG